MLQLKKGTRNKCTVSDDVRSYILYTSVGFALPPLSSSSLIDLKRGASKIGRIFDGGKLPSSITTSYMVRSIPTVDRSKMDRRLAPSISRFLSTIPIHTHTIMGRNKASRAFAHSK